jgi:epoxide hydrolase
MCPLTPSDSAPKWRMQPFWNWLELTSLKEKMMSMTPYTIAIPQADLGDLPRRLARVRWTNELAGVGEDYGVALPSVKRLVEYWQSCYDWRLWEAKLNAYPQFTTTIDGQNIHFLQIRSKADNALPLILTHGWPMSVVDYLDLIGPLTDPRSHGDEAVQAFHLVIPSLPGFGFSGPTTERGWDRYRVARAWAELMHRLGYERYGAHGIDWGSIVSQEVGRCDPEHVIGVHVTQIFSFPSGDPTELEALSEEEKNGWQAINGGKQIWGDMTCCNPPCPRPWLTPWPTRQWASLPGTTRCSETR